MIYTIAQTLKLSLYVDDSVLTLSHKNVNCLQSKLNLELHKINAWLNYNQLSLNVAKTNYILFTKKKENIKLHLRESALRQTDCIKYLVVYTDVYTLQLS